MGSLLRLRDAKEFKEYELDFCSEFDKAGRDVLARAHSDEYLNFVSMLAKQHKRAAAAAAAQPSLSPPTAAGDPLRPEFNEKAKQLKTSEEASSPSDSIASTNSTSSQLENYPNFSPYTFNAARRSAGERAMPSYPAHPSRCSTFPDLT